MRQTNAELQIPAATVDIPYVDHHRLVASYLEYGVEAFVGQVVGAGGAGGSVTSCPFEPALVIISEATGPLLNLYMNLATPINLNMISGAVHGTSPTITKVADGNFTIALGTALAPDGDTATVIALGFKQGSVSL